MKATDDTWTTLRVLTWTSDYLAGKGVANARREAEWLLCAVTGLDRVGLYLNFDKPMSDDELAAFRALVARRAKREPLQYLLGSQEFDGLQFAVTPAVLIPRHDTETLLAAALRQSPAPCTILDIGTGSGCLAVSLARRLPQARVTAVDISPEALAVARTNAERNGVVVEFLQGSFFEPLAGRRFELIVSNPPYITSAEMTSLQPEVRDFEPHLALHGGSDGLAAYRVIAASAPHHLEPGGRLWCEIGQGQEADLTALLASAGFVDIVALPDEAGILRVVGGIWNGV